MKLVEIIHYDDKWLYSFPGHEDEFDERIFGQDGKRYRVSFPIKKILYSTNHFHTLYESIIGKEKHKKTIRELMRHQLLEKAYELFPKDIFRIIETEEEIPKKELEAFYCRTDASVIRLETELIVYDINFCVESRSVLREDCLKMEVK